MDANCKAVVLTDHILDHLSRIDSKQDRIFEELKGQAETLARNTVSLEEHIRRTDLLEEHLYQQKDEINTIKEKVEKVSEKQVRVDMLFSVLKPTKAKIKILAILLGLLSGGYQLTSKNPLAIIQKIEKIIE